MASVGEVRRERTIDRRTCCVCSATSRIVAGRFPHRARRDAGSRVFSSELITIGRLRIIDASGCSHDIARAPGPSAAIRLHDPALNWKLAVRPRLYLPEAFVDGTLTIEEGSLYDLLDLFALNLEALPDGLLSRVLNGSVTLMRRVHQYNPMSRARQNVAHHYDLSDELYELFLDKDRQYSCAYFRRSSSTTSIRRSSTRSATSRPS